MSPENQWFVQMYFVLNWNSPFLGDMLGFGGVQTISASFSLKAIRFETAASEAVSGVLNLLLRRPVLGGSRCEGDIERNFSFLAPTYKFVRNFESWFCKCHCVFIPSLCCKKDMLAQYNLPLNIIIYDANLWIPAVIFWSFGIQDVRLVVLITYHLEISVLGNRIRDLRGDLLR